MASDVSIEKKSSYETNWRWWVLGTLFLATFLNYFDRQTLGTAIEPISKEFGLDNIHRGELLSAFIFAYAFTHIFMGFYIDRVKNIGIFFPIMVLGWSISTILAGFVSNYKTLVWLRYLLGFFEAVNFPICLLIIAHIFPAKERSLASGIFASGAFLATLAAPPVVIYFSNTHNWRDSFIVAGSLGVLWLIPWFLIFKKPELKSEGWKEFINQKNMNAAINNKLSGIFKGFFEIIKKPSFWGVALIGLGIVPSLYFATQWFPSFFTQQLNQVYDQALATKLTIIYFMQDVGLWVGGAIVLWLSHKGVSILKSRKAVMTGAFVLMLGSMLAVTTITDVNIGVILLSLYVCGIGAFLGNQHAFKQDVDTKQVAAVSALVGFIETGFTAFIIKEIGILTEISHNFTIVFFLLAGLVTISIACVFYFLRPKWVNIK